MSPIPGSLDLSDERVPKASFSTIDFALLEARDPAELVNLLRACQTHGFFYLNFDNSDTTKSIVKEKTRVQEFMKQYFSQPMDAKMQDHQGIKTKGYVPADHPNHGLTHSFKIHPIRDIHRPQKGRLAHG